MVYQMLCLNVAINSYDNALLSLLMSNQFVEIKGSVFKKFEKDNLFQITCAGLLVRFCSSSKVLNLVGRYRRAIYPRPYANFCRLSKFDRALWVRIRFQWRDVSPQIIWVDWRQRFVDDLLCGWSLVSLRAVHVFYVARPDRYALRNPRGLAQTRLYHQI
jgi:hypothetical protein